MLKSDIGYGCSIKMQTLKSDQSLDMLQAGICKLVCFRDSSCSGANLKTFQSTVRQPRVVEIEPLEVRQPFELFKPVSVTFVLLSDSSSSSISELRCASHRLLPACFPEIASVIGQPFEMFQTCVRYLRVVKRQAMKSCQFLEICNPASVT